PKQGQEPKQSLARSFYWSQLRVGDDLPPLTKPAIDRVQIVRYAASSGDFNRLHLDEPYAHAVGFPGLFAPGMLAMAFVGQLLTAWLRRGHVRKLGARFIKIVWPGDELTCHGRIAELRRETGACYADVELWAENQKGELVLRGQATCEQYESPQNGGGDGGGLLCALQQPGPAASQGPAKKSAPTSKPPKEKREGVWPRDSARRLRIARTEQYPEPEASTMGADAQECAADAHRARAGAGIEAEALYLWAVCSAIWSRMQGFTPLIERRGELTAAFLRVAQLAPDLDGAGAERELGALYAALPAYAGGDLEEARRYLLAAVQRAPEDARNHVVLARAVAVKEKDRALFREHLEAEAKSGAAIAAEHEREMLEREREVFDG